MYFLGNGYVLYFCIFYSIYCLLDVFVIILYLVLYFRIWMGFKDVRRNYSFWKMVEKLRMFSLEKRSVLRLLVLNIGSVIFYMDVS